MKLHKNKTDSILLPVLVAEEVKKFIFKEKRTSIYFNNHEILVEGLKEIYWSKRVFIKLLDQMIRMSSSENLADILEEYQVVTHRQSRRMEDIFVILSLKPVGKICVPLQRSINEAFKRIGQMYKGSERDEEFISVVLQIQRYWAAKGEILCEMAETLTEGDVKTLLEETKEECKLLDMNLAYLVESKLIKQASE